ncbi:ribose transport system ATP-binding protein [Caminicella sporogenes DSM 14501]|uniref:Ribose transport system ATP-binding protein n=1 Tax=Caminicella sporogenes DSM 14501 TaxID=1121266 RepID=A0A1M6PG71_9FIRM|nr:ribose ABC transporter ATP-binding protein RbsA [Caminicella sporogenes]SHK06914.1 ribose transport system ATP-binding protein [Caminicella sporogenes DSM 14501]
MNYILEMKEITKSFPGVLALDKVNFRVPKGKVMALLGENGAGKSTLMKILSGVYQKTSGKIYFKGREVNFNSPREAQNSGIAIIHQELNLIPELTIAENIFLGREPINILRKIDKKQLYKRAVELLEFLGVKENPQKKISELSIGKQQMVEIAKALSLDAEIIIMDEPTDALTDKETVNLFKVINTLKTEGKSIVYISHRMKEIFEICDYVTVLRDGKFIGEKSIEEINEDDLIEMMVGRKLTEQYPRIEINLGKKVLEVKNLSNELISDISFDLYEGEILGVAGLMGSGRTELARTIYGAIKAREGEILLDGKKLNIKSPSDAIKYGIAYVSEDRKGDGLVLGMTVKENMSLSALNKFTGLFGYINKSKEIKSSKEYVEKISIKTPSINQTVKNLSGGNQQKVSISKSLMTKPRVLILDEPTRGVDVGAKKEIYDLMNEFKKQGMSIIMISSEIPEILGMSDRILIMHEGRLSGILNIKDATQEKIMKLAVGIKEA